jgi:hypothetical protein
MIGKRRIHEDGMQMLDTHLTYKDTKEKVAFNFTCKFLLQNNRWILWRIELKG